MSWRCRQAGGHAEGIDELLMSAVHCSTVRICSEDSIILQKEQYAAFGDRGQQLPIKRMTQACLLHLLQLFVNQEVCIRGYRELVLLLEEVQLQVHLLSRTGEA